MRPHRLQQPYRKAFARWLVTGPWPPEETTTFEVEGRTLNVEQLLAEFDDDTAPVNRHDVWLIFNLDRTATWADAARAAKEQLAKDAADQVDGDHRGDDA